MMRLISFGYGHGDPPRADVTIDLRRILTDLDDHSDLIELTGLDLAVQLSVMSNLNAPKVVHLLGDILSPVLGDMPSPVMAGARLISSIAVGCSGGRHRSVAILEIFVGAYAPIDCEILHRDIAKPILSNEED
jgi:RNase adaptor protein for sRNA GlmZ degradation